ncbi:MAG: ATP-binding protein [Lachnospiraceae bacterium]|nr:ATP-binding protein [Lachnospiraceae bacterium]
MLERSLQETEQTFTLWKTSVHDYKHSIVNLTALARQGDMQGILEYLARENELLGQQLFFYKTGNETVDTILNIKKKTAQDRGIPFLIHAQIPPDCGIMSADFASLLGNLLDNAIEASALEADPYIEVRIKPVKDYLILNISNRCTKTNDTRRTQKPQGYLHGIGLSSVRQTVSRYDGEFTTERDGEVFEALVMLPLGSK